MTDLVHATDPEPRTCDPWREDYSVLYQRHARRVPVTLCGLPTRDTRYSLRIDQFRAEPPANRCKGCAWAAENRRDLQAVTA